MSGRGNIGLLSLVPPKDSTVEVEPYGEKVDLIEKGYSQVKKSNWGFIKPFNRVCAIARDLKGEGVLKSIKKTSNSTLDFIVCSNLYSRYTHSFNSGQIDELWVKKLDEEELSFVEEFILYKNKVLRLERLIS
jgi:hypothetical protein